MLNLQRAQLFGTTVEGATTNDEAVTNWVHASTAVVMARRSVRIL